MQFICGILNFDDKPVDPDLLDRTLDMVAGRSTTHRGIWTEASIGLGYLTKSWTTSPVEPPPLIIHDERVVLTANARIDDRDELLRKLKAKPSSHESTPEGQPILLAWRKWGDGCVEHLFGDFAFAHYDRREHQLTCVQSPCLLTPIYFVRTKASFAFASLIRPLLRLADLPKRLNEQALACFVSSGYPISNKGEYVAEKELMFAGVEGLPGASILSVKRTGVLNKRQWWRPSATERLQLANESEYFDGVRDLLMRAVHDRMRGSEHIAASLSGGLDSSSIACIAAQKLREDGRRLTAISSVLPSDYRGRKTDERGFIEIVAQSEELNVLYVQPPASIIDDAGAHLELMDYLEHPTPVHKQYVYSAFHEGAAQHDVNAILDGCYGECGPSSHGHYVHAWMARSGQWLALWRQLHQLAGNSQTSLLRLFLRYVVAPHFPRPMREYHRWRSPARAVRPFVLPLNADFAHRHSIRQRRQYPDRLRWVDLSKPLRDIVQSIESSLSFSVPYLSASMVKGIPTYYPFFDRRLLEFCLAVPPHVFWANGWKRSLIRHAMQDILPVEIQWRTTKGAFAPNFYEHFQASCPAICKELHSMGPNELAHDYFDVNAMLAQLDMLKGKAGDETTTEGLIVKRCILDSLAGIRFLQWFDRQSVNGE